MKNAKEMFEELGYKYSEDDYFISYIEHNDSKPVKYQIIFSKEYKCVEIIFVMFDKPHYFTRINIDLLKAINKQIEELGWDNE